MKIALLGYFGFGNAGDEAILAAEIAALRAAFAAEVPAGGSPGASANQAEPTFVVISGDPDHTRRTHGVDAVSRTDVRAVLAVLRESAALVAGGGSLLQDVTSARPVAFYAGTMLAARAVGTPVFVYAQGLGPVRRPVNRALTGAALRASRYVALRDADSVALAERLGVRHVDLVPDPVLGLDLSAGRPPSLGGERPRLAVALRPWAGSEDWLPAVRSALADLAPEADVVLVPFHAGQDADLARELAADLGSGAEVVDVGAAGRAGHRAALDAVAGATAVLGMRLHALIAAAGAGRPFVALSYDPKVTAFADRVGQPVAATLPGPSGSTVDRAELRENVVAAVRKALQGPDQSYLDRLAALRADAARPATTIARSLLAH
ncbi:polysaccharide pyruvyl transferase CsaB [Actinopolymorpha cephalotaxi]|uniref:Polysaccharide pyruvyl transferase CsaB n=1 Tax=Actinopolymorpha cephalotaxi TaxID=504797 RepID=A0A1I2UFQ5_9ACTN|nr:polysaccharide pyruvyl transferase CsaB [Actinopolymorpha cephalotaxi]NYH86494.1 polysaccharide pyruvyl transferase CsaB [Actinopolymorpha cephalotaxi]SFG73686.1 polysaccharide pyruvyl transferase CsaB [Actinopolymorpha cephalotaxi]